MNLLTASDTWGFRVAYVSLDWTEMKKVNKKDELRAANGKHGHLSHQQTHPCHICTVSKWRVIISHFQVAFVSRWDAALASWWAGWPRHTDDAEQYRSHLCSTANSLPTFTEGPPRHPRDIGITCSTSSPVLKPRMENMSWIVPEHAWLWPKQGHLTLHISKITNCTRRQPPHRVQASERFPVFDGTLTGKLAKDGNAFLRPVKWSYCNYII